MTRAEQILEEIKKETKGYTKQRQYIIAFKILMRLDELDSEIQQLREEIK